MAKRVKKREPIKFTLRFKNNISFNVNKWIIHILGILSVVLLYLINRDLSGSFIISILLFIIAPFYSIYKKRASDVSCWLFSYIMFWVSLNIEYWLSNNYIICFIFVILGFVMILIIYKVEYSNVFLFTFCILVSYFLGEPIMVGVLYVYSRDLIYFF